MGKALKKVEEKLLRLKQIHEGRKTYLIPRIWDDPYTVGNDIIEVDPFEFFLDKIYEILKAKRRTGKELHKDDIRVYNMLVRYAAAFDHDGDGKINTHILEDGLRETGTFLKTIALLPYIKSLGANALYLLPITMIGEDGRKGTLGSPYAISDHYKQDDILSEPALHLDTETEFLALVEAAHMIDMKVILEFVFRTASIDSRRALDHPEWFYWIKSDTENRPQDSKDEKQYGPPVFTEDELLKIKEKVKAGDFKDLPEPHDVYKDMFQPVPDKVELKGGKIRGYKDGIESRIPGAFSDWPPDDNQPAWSDVTYLRLFDHKDYNYIAYNTVRMYEKKLTRKNYRVESLWENICRIIPHYQEKFGIDGVLIDMGHSLPPELRAELIRRPREKNPDFIFWEENFTLDKKSAREGYDATVGYMMFDAHNPQKINELIEFLSEDKSPIPFFLTAENHNTPRAATRPGGEKFSEMIWAMSCFLPGVLFLHSGFELAEKHPVNTGLGFTSDEIKLYPPEELPLFSEGQLPWTNDSRINDKMRRLIELRDEFTGAAAEFDKTSIHKPECSNENIAAFLINQKYKKPALLFMANMDAEKEIYFHIDMPDDEKKLRERFTGTEYDVINGGFLYHLKPFEYFVAEIIY